MDLSRTETIRDSWIESRSQWTPYDGVTVKGWPVGTYVRGTPAMWQGEILGTATGQPARFQDALIPEKTQ